MNSQYTIAVKVDAGGAIGNLNEVEEVVKKSNSNLIEMRQELKRLQSELLALEPGTEEFNKLAMQAGKVKDQMNDVAEQVRANAAPAFESVGNQAALFKDKLLNLDLAGAGESMTALGGSIKKVSFKEATSGALSFGKGMLDLGKALLTNPLFLLVSVITAIVTNFEKLRNAGGFIGEMFSAIGDTIDGAIQMLKDLADWLGLTDLKAEERAKAEEERKKKQEKADKEAKKKAEKEQKEQERKDKEAADKKAAADKAAYEKRQAWLKLLRDAETAANKARQEEEDALFAELEKLDEDFYQSKLSNREKDLQKVDEYFFDLITRAEKQVAAGEMTEQELTAIKEHYSRIRQDITDKYDKEELKAIEEKNAKLKDIAEQMAQDEEELDERIFQATLSAQDKERKAVEYKYAQDLADAKLHEKNWQALQTQMDNELAEIDKKYKDEEVARQKETMEKKVQMVSDSLTILSNLTELFGKQGEEQTKRQFEINKAASIGQALISTFLAVNNALTAGGNPAKLATGAQFVEAGVALTMGLLNVSKIAKTKYKGGSASGGGGGSAGAPSSSMGGSPTPAFNPMDTEFLNNRPGQQQAPPIKTYVLQNEVATSQEAAEKISALTTIG